jgi:4'-phosphopantetheinyl transferase
LQLFYTSFQGSGHDAAYSLLAYAVKKEYAIDLPALEKTPGGKPFFPGRKEIHFSLSHTRGYALCALSRENVGCDMETVTRPIGDALRLRVCTPDQLAAFDFFTLWTLKESFIKYTGRLDRPIRELCFTRDGDTIRIPESRLHCAVYDLYPCRAAVVGAETPPETCIYVPPEALVDFPTV